MDVKEFVDSRNRELSEFDKSYKFLKQSYSTSLAAAIQEQDPSKQQELIQQVLQVNSEMVESLREILSKLNQGQDSFNPKTLDELTADLIKYQKDYAEIEKTKDKVQTLKLIQANNTKKLQEATTMYYVYIVALIVLVFLITYLVFKTSFTSVIQQVTQPLIPQA